MFIIRKAQLEAFRVPVRKKKRDTTFLQLQAVDGNKVSQESDKIIVEDSKGRKSTLLYSEKNLLTAFTKPSGIQVKFAYDDDDRVNNIKLPGNEEIQLAYANDVPTNISLNGTDIQLKYDGKSRLSEIEYPDARSIFFEYNDLNQISAVIDRVGAKQQYQTLIEDGRLVHHLKDTLGRTTTLRMDTTGGLETIVFPDSSTCEVRYDEVLEAEVVKLRNGTTRTTYLDGPYPYRVEWEDGHYQDISLNETLQVERIENQSGTIGYEYDEKQRLVSEAFQDLKVSYQYEEDYLSSMVYPSGLEVRYEYDEDDRLARLSIDGQTVSYVYAPNGTLAEVHYPNGLIEYQTNLVLGGLQESKLAKPSGQVVSQQVYQYDKLARLASYRQYDQHSEPKDWKFEYDAEGRLADVTEGASGHHESFRYDIKGNLKQANRQPVAVGLMDEVISIGNKIVSYDNGGNVNQFIDEHGRKIQLKYADDGTLKLSKTNEDVWEYWYDALGRRVGKSNGKETYKFFWSGEKLLREEYTLNDEAVVREFIYIDDNTPIAFKEKGGIFWLKQDVRGAITDAYDTKGVLVWKATYTAFGKAIISTAKIKQSWRLAGQYYDEETGLHYNQSRYFSPFLLSFLALDPLWQKYGATNYSYAANDPYNRIDKDGQFWHIVAGGVIGAVVGGAVSAYMAPEGEKASALLHGALQGAFAGALAAATGGAGIIAGAAGSGIGEALAGFIEGGKICEDCVKQALLNGLAGGIAGFAIGKALGPVFTSATKRITQNVRFKTYAYYVKNRYKKSFAADFITNGIKTGGVPKDIYNDMLMEYPAGTPNHLKERYLKEVIESGVDIPIKKVILPGDHLLKLTPVGKAPGYSPFYMTKYDYLKWKASGEHPGQIFGLPLNSQAGSYDVVVITARKKVVVFESTIANTKQGSFKTIGGEKQILVLDVQNKDKWLQSTLIK